jgi:hypothetical protein
MMELSRSIGRGHKTIYWRQLLVLDSSIPYPVRLTSSEETRNFISPKALYISYIPFLPNSSMQVLQIGRFCTAGIPPAPPNCHP